MVFPLKIALQDFGVYTAFFRLMRYGWYDFYI